LEVVVLADLRANPSCHRGPSGEVTAQWQAWIGMISFDVVYRQLAEKTENVFGKQELLDLATVCEEVANSIEDRLTGG
jgi:hypothetical protein